MAFSERELAALREQLEESRRIVEHTRTHLQKAASVGIDSDLIQMALSSLEKRAFVPPGGGAPPGGPPPGGPPPGGMPPGMPPMGGPPPGGMPPGMPPMGGPPPGGMPPMGGPPPGGMPPGMPPMGGPPPGMPPMPGMPGGPPPDMGAMPGGMDLAALGLPPELMAQLGGGPPPEGGAPPGPSEGSSAKVVDMSVDEFKGAMTEAVEKGMSSAVTEITRGLDDVVDQLKSLIATLSANAPGVSRPLR